MKQLITICCVAVWTPLIGSVLAADSAKTTSEDVARGGKSVSDFLTPDGRFDLNAVRSSGYQGPLYLKGVDVRVDPRSGVPTVAAFPQSPADDPDDQYWDNSMSMSVPGVDGFVIAAVIYDGKLIVGGAFAGAGNIVANNIAAWDGTNWSPLGSGIEDFATGAVYALTVFNGSLVAGGEFYRAGGEVVNNVASWDGTSWSPLGTGMGGSGQGDYVTTVCALTVWNNRLIAGGEFYTAGGSSAENIASWDGTNWSPLGTGTPFYARALTVYNGNLIAGGASTIVSWDGTSWSSLGAGFWGGNTTVEALTVYNGSLIAAGANAIASWDGTSWSQMETGLGGDYFKVNALTVYNGSLVAAGYFSTAGGTGFNHITSWDGNSWSLLGTGVNSGVGTLTVYDGRLIAGGDFTLAGGITANHIASWDGADWSPLKQRMNNNVLALTVYDGKLIAGGDFEYVGNCKWGRGCAVNNIASWGGSGWSPMGLGVNGGVLALTVYDGKLIAGGLFDSAGGVAANNIAAWNGTSWSPLGAGIKGLYSCVSAITTYDNKLIVGGYFETAGDVPAKCIASWDGLNWSPLGMYISREYPWVAALAVYDGKLIAGGEIEAFWDGTNWVEFGSSVAKAMAVYGNKLMIGGTTIFGFTETYVYTTLRSWDGSTWNELFTNSSSSSEGPPSNLDALTVYEGKLIVGGTFAPAQDQWVNSISSWDGTNWSQLGSGLNGVATALAVFDNKLFVGGSFTTAGGKVSAGLAAWTKHDPTDVDDGQTGTLPNTFSLVQNYPNPFNPTTTIEYSVPTRSHVTLEIFNLLGQHVKTLIEERKSAGNYKAEWNGTDGAGNVVSTGVYLYRFKAGDFVETKKMLLLK